MRDRLAAAVERFVAASEDDPLVLAAGALVVIAVLAVLIGLGIAFGALLWIGRPWSLILLPVVGLGIAVASDGRDDSSL